MPLPRARHTHLMGGGLAPSIFNDVVGPIMRGPSSSHSAAAVRIGLLLHDLCGGVPERVALQYDSLGSLATTHESQGTDMGLYGGMLGWEPDDARLATSPTVLAAMADIVLEKPELGDAHPNTYRIEVSRSGVAHSLVALSTGGGMIEIIEIDGFEVSLFGDYAQTLLFFSSEADVDELVSTFDGLDSVDAVHTSTNATGSLFVLCGAQKHDVDSLRSLCGPHEVGAFQWRCVLPIRSRRGLTTAFDHASEIAQEIAAAPDRPLSDWALTYEMQRGDATEQEVLAYAQRLLDIMRNGIAVGLACTDYNDRILGWQSGGFVEKQQRGELLDGGLLNSMIAYVTALMEAKSAMEVIIAAPTAGACATFPGALVATLDALDSTNEQAQRALLTGGLIGVLFANRSSFAAEVGGCQAETGAGSAMAAAALTELGGGTAAQSLSAASQAIQNVLGLICDPVGNRVEAPCLGRNVAGAANALSCANMALAGYDHVIPLDEVLDAHKQVSELMARELRCTGLGGLAVTPTAQRIELDLSRHRAQ